MVYKVSGNFTNENLNEFINKLKKRYTIVLREESMYLALNSYSAEVDFDDRNDLGTIQSCEVTQDRLTNELKNKVFIPLGDFFVKDLTKKTSIEREDEFIQTWCKEHINRLAREIVEVENQVQLRTMMNCVNSLEIELEERLKKISEGSKTEEGSETNEGSKDESTEDT